MSATFELNRQRDSEGVARVGHGVPVTGPVTPLW